MLFRCFLVYIVNGICVGSFEFFIIPNSKCHMKWIHKRMESVWKLIEAMRMKLNPWEFHVLCVQTSWRRKIVWSVMWNEITRENYHKGDGSFCSACGFEFKFQFKFEDVYGYSFCFQCDFTQITIISLSFTACTFPPWIQVLWSLNSRFSGFGFTLATQIALQSSWTNNLWYIRFCFSTNATAIVILLSFLKVPLVSSTAGWWVSRCIFSFV